MIDGLRGQDPGTSMEAAGSESWLHHSLAVHVCVYVCICFVCVHVCACMYVSVCLCVCTLSVLNLNQQNSKIVSYCIILETKGRFGDKFLSQGWKYMKTCSLLFKTQSTFQSHNLLALWCPGYTEIPKSSLCKEYLEPHLGLVCILDVESGELLQLGSTETRL